MNRKSVLVVCYGISAVVFVLDRITKLLIQRYFTVWDTVTVIPGFFSIIHTENPGAAFSMFADAPAHWRVLILVALSSVAMAVIGVMLWRSSARAGESWCLRLGLSLILGGALGNMYDRVLRRTVTDFLEFYYRGFSWPAFNVADSAITVGACLVILDMLLSRRTRQTAQAV